jgi:hypothetical protein
MGMRALNPVACGRLLAVELPKRAKNERQFNRLVARLEGFWNRLRMKWFST